MFLIFCHINLGDGQWVTTKPSRRQIVHARLAIDRDVIDIAKFSRAFAQAVIDRLGRQPGPMLDPAKALLLRGGDEFAIDNQARGGIGVVGVKAQDDHCGTISNCGLRLRISTPKTLSGCPAAGDEDGDQFFAFEG